MIHHEAVVYVNVVSMKRLYHVTFCGRSVPLSDCGKESTIFLHSLFASLITLNVRVAFAVHCATVQQIAHTI